MAKEKNQESSLAKKVWYKFANYGGIDIWFLIIVLALLCVGLIMMFSAGYPYALYKYNDSTYFIKRQFFFAIIGVVAMLLISHVKPEFWRATAKLIAGLSTGLLLLVLVLPPDEDGFRRWLRIGGHSLFQPSEITKFAVIIVGAYIFNRYSKRMSTNRPSKTPVGKWVNGKLGAGIVRESWDPAWQYCLFFGISAVLVFAENHLSGCILIFALGVIMLFIGGVRGRWFAVGISLVLVVALIVCVPVALQIQDVHEQLEAASDLSQSEQNALSDELYDELINGGKVLKGYMRERIVSWLDKDYSPRDARWQTNQALYAIGTGGFFGKGLGNSTQKYMYVSEPQNDMIFSIVCEELGFAGAALIIGLFVLLVYRGVVIGLNANTRFGMLLAMGIVFQVGVQVMLNIAVASDVIPNTGISLPFFSYGGTSLCMLLGEMGIVLSVSRDGRIQKK